MCHFIGSLILCKNKIMQIIEMFTAFYLVLECCEFAIQNVSTCNLLVVKINKSYSKKCNIYTGMIIMVPILI